MQVLLAGATGETGLELVRALSEARHSIRVLVRSESRDKLDPVKVHLDGIHEGDVTLPGTLTGCCSGIDVVVSTITRTRSGEQHTDVDYSGNLALLKEAEAAGVRRFVFISSLGAGSVRAVPVLEHKGRFEAALRDSRLEWLIVRPSALFLDMERIFDMARSGRLWLFGNGRQRVSPMAEADLANLIVSRLRGGSETIECGGPETLTMEEVGRMAQRVLGLPERVRLLPLWIFAGAVSVARYVAPDAWPVLRFVQYVFGSDNVGQPVGATRLEDHFRRLARRVNGAGDTARIFRR